MICITVISFWNLGSPIIFKGNTVEAQDSANKNEEGNELYEHGSGIDHMSMPQDNRNCQTPHS